jgi:hypothetical protein
MLQNRHRDCGTSRDLGVSTKTLLDRVDAGLDRLAALRE